jgi:hypothetical protein
MLAGKALKKIKPVAASFEWQFEEGSIVYFFVCVQHDAAPLSVINFKFTTYTQEHSADYLILIKLASATVADVIIILILFVLP